MELELKVKITPNVLFDYLLYYTYTGLQGIIGTVVGLFLIFAFIRGFSVLYLIAGLIIIVYLPVSLFLRSRRQYLNNPVFREQIDYLIDDDGLKVSQGERYESIPWENIIKAVSTPNSILLYTSKVNASIFPKKDLGEKRALFIEAVCTHVEPKRVRIRG